jgi:hypothetical protein
MVKQARGVLSVEARADDKREEGGFMTATTELAGASMPRKARQESPEPGRRASTELGGTARDRRIGMWSARAVFVFGAAYAITMVAGFASLGNLADPLPDPYLAIAEILILFMAPVMVMLMVAIHACALLAPARSA